MENILIRGLTEEEKERLHEMQMKRAIEEGLAEGREKGEEDIIRMNEYLLDNGRLEDLKRATKDEEFRKRILEEMSL